MNQMPLLADVVPLPPPKKAKALTPREPPRREAELITAAELALIDRLHGRLSAKTINAAREKAPVSAAECESRARNKHGDSSMVIVSMEEQAASLIAIAAVILMRAEELRSAPAPKEKAPRVASTAKRGAAPPNWRPAARARHDEPIGEPVPLGMRGSSASAPISLPMAPPCAAAR